MKQDNLYKLINNSLPVTFLVLCLLTYATSSFAQIVPTAGETECFLAGNSGIFTDPGGLGGDDAVEGAPGNYPNCGCTTTTTLCSPDGSAITLSFVTFGVFATFDNMQIYDGDTPAGTLLFDNSVAIGGVTVGDLAEMITATGGNSFTGTTGCITVVFEATGVVDDSGWDADVTTASGASHPGDNLDCDSNISCLAPGGISIDAVLANSADISWMVSDSADSYNIQLGPAGFVLGSGDISNTSDLDFTFMNLQENTTYDFYMQSDCGDNDFSNQSGPFSFTTPFLNPPDTCFYTFNLFDSFGDGWNGGFLTVTVNGNATDYTIPAGGDEATYTVAGLSNQSFVVSFTAGGFLNEVSYEILDPSGLIIFEDGPNPAQGEVLSIFACPTCPAPGNISIEELNGDNVLISWNPVDTPGVFIIEYGPSGFLPGNGQTVTTGSTSYELTGLSENTVYDYYIFTDCDNGDSSAVVGANVFQTIYLNDVAVTNIHTPITACGLGVEEVSVSLGNFGQNPQSLIPFKFSVNDEPVDINVPLDGYYTGVIGNGNTAMVTFETTYDFSEPGIYVIKAWTELDNESNIANDTFVYTFTNIPVVSTFPYFTNFEDWDGGWTVSDSSINNSWQFGEPIGATISSAASGVNAFVTNLSGNYNNNELSFVTSPCFDFSTITEDPNITFSINYETETNWDGAWLEGSKDGGMTFEKIGTMGTGLNWYTINNTTQGLGDVWGGNSGGWVVAENTLTGFAGEGDCIFRFAFDTDGSGNFFDGIGIDDIFISPPLANDVAVLTVTHLSESECGDPQDRVSIDIRNGGTEAQSGFDVSYQINGGDIVTENLGPINIPAGDVFTYLFSNTFDSNVYSTTFDIVAWTSLPAEQNIANDTSSFAFTTVTPTPLPFVEDFEAGEPTTWDIAADIGVGDGHNAGSFVLFDNMFSGDTEFLATTPLIGPINPGDSLTFDYRYTNWSAGTTGATLAGDMLEIQISTDCGETFTTVFTVDQTNHVTSNVFTNRTVDLDPYANEVINIRFFGTHASGDYWLDLDNINIIGCPQNFVVDFNTMGESTAGGDGAATAVPLSGQGPYTYMWDNGETTETITGLAAGTYMVTIQDANGCSDVASVEVVSCPADLDTDFDLVFESEMGLADGSISVIPTGGSDPYTYIWSNGGTNASINGLSAGDYTVTINDANGCSEVLDFTIDIGVNTSELGDLMDITLAPNPTANTARLNLNFNQTVDVQVQVISLMGQMIFETESQGVRSEEYLLDLNNYAAGIYFVRVIVEDQIHVEKLIKTGR